MFVVVVIVICKIIFHRRGIVFEPVRPIMKHAGHEMRNDHVYQLNDSGRYQYATRTYPLFEIMTAFADEYLSRALLITYTCK